MSNLPDQRMQTHTEEEPSIDIKSILAKIGKKWHWFIISVVLCLIIAVLYAKYTPPVYQINARVLVNDDEKGGGLGKEAGALMDLGGVLGSKNSVENEVEILQTRFLLEQVVREMQLNFEYFYESGFVRRELQTSPFKINITNAVDSIQYTSLEIEKLPGNRLRVVTEDLDQEVKWYETFKIENVGNVQLVPFQQIRMPDGHYGVNISSIDDRVSNLIDQLTVEVSNKQVTIVDLGLTYALPARGEEVLRTLIRRYTQINLEDKNAVADSTYKFIMERISVISSELGNIENNVQSFKQDNKLADMTEQSKLLVKNTGEFASDLAKAETQVTILNDLEAYLQDGTKNKRVFPTSLLPSDMVFSGLMEQYNTLLIERDKQLLSVTETSPFIKNIDTQIAGLRAGVLSNIQSTKNTFVVTRDRLRSQLKQTEGQIGGVPQIEKRYLDLARNQQIKQELYIFLMQKAEETAISKTSNISIAKTIDPPKSEVKPVSPKNKFVYLAGFFAGLVIPLLLLLVKSFFETTIQTKEDITNLTRVPVIGEISHNTTSDNLIVASNGRSAISEQFRALRTNLSFYLKTKEQKVILLTSSMSGEGKSFTAINLGNILALSGKKVLLMELDLRKPGLSVKLDIKNSMGFSNYVIDESLTVDQLITPLDINKNLFIVSSGPLPPNPAETILSDRTEELMTELKARFDYIIMDAPPVGIITDAQLLSPFADLTIYVVRQGITQKKQLEIVDELYRNDKMKNLSIVVNDIESKEYGFGYGYGNYADEQKGNMAQELAKKFRRS